MIQNALTDFNGVPSQHQTNDEIYLESNLFHYTKSNHKRNNINTGTDDNFDFEKALGEHDEDDEVKNVN